MRLLMKSRVEMASALAEMETVLVMLLGGVTRVWAWPLVWERTEAW